MKKILLFLSCALLLGCKDNFDITKLNGTDKLVVYCFPSPGDTTDIDVGRSQPVNGKGNAVMIADASVTYQVNGVALTIRNLGDGHYQAIGQQRERDRITLSVKANGLPGTMAETTIPTRLAIEKFEVDTVNMYDRDYEAFRESERFADTRAEFHRPDGEGYTLWRDEVLRLDRSNPQLAARMARTLDRHQRFVPVLAQQMHAVLEHVAHEAQSPDVREVIAKEMGAL